MLDFLVNLRVDSWRNRRLRCGTSFVDRVDGAAPPGGCGLKLVSVADDQGVLRHGVVVAPHAGLAVEVLDPATRNLVAIAMLEQWFITRWVRCLLVDSLV